MLTLAAVLRKLLQGSREEEAEGTVRNVITVSYYRK
jgi:hypothetical protein